MEALHVCTQSNGTHVHTHIHVHTRIHAHTHIVYIHLAQK